MTLGPFLIQFATYCKHSKS